MTVRYVRIMIDQTVLLGLSLLRLSGLNFGRIRAFVRLAEVF
ncbi:hypothetical protein ABIB34_000592 [Rhodococcus sp. UYP5]